MLALMEEGLAELLVSQPARCRLWPEQTEGPYHRDVPPERTEISEDRPGVSLRLGLRLLAMQAATPLAGVLVEVWHADHEGRYSGFQPFRAQPGQVVTSESVPREIVAPNETFLRGAQRTDQLGMCAFRTIYPGWYPSRTVHVHLRAHLGERTATTQLYFPDEVTDDVFTVSTYEGRSRRDTTNDTDSIFTDEGGEESVLHLAGNVTAGYTGVLCFAVAATRSDVASTEA
jgi:protocatechuate 3,4-dioxygenase beta subunit